VLRACRNEVDTSLQKVRWFEGNELFDSNFTARSEWMKIRNGLSPARETMPGLALTNSVHKDASAGVAARGLSAAAGAGVSVIQPTPGLFVGPTGDGKARRRRHTLAGTNDDILGRA
jgi:hypothetical protein